MIERLPNATGRDRRTDSEHRRRQRCPTADYRRPVLQALGSLATLVRGASWKGVDSLGEIDPENSYPG